MPTYRDRRGTNSYKWDVKPPGAPNDLISMWVADMDFQAPQEVINAIVRRAEHGIFGYTFRDDEYYQSLINWQKNHHNVDLKKEWIVPVPNVMYGIAAAIRTFTVERSGIIIQPPVYWPFFKIIEINNRKVVENPLIYENGRYKINFEDLEEKAKHSKMILLCSPHNPVGRVWEEEEIVKVLEIARRNNLLVVSDEIHSDIVFKKFHSVLKYVDVYENIIVLTSPHKTFNMPSLHVANAFIPSESIRDKFQELGEAIHVNGVNPLSVDAAKAAYTYGEEWLKEILKYIRENMEIVKNWADGRNYIDAYLPEGTYLMWLDFRKAQMEHDRLFQRILKAGVWLQDGKKFGMQGEGFMRMNVATSRDIVKEAIKRIDSAFL